MLDRAHAEALDRDDPLRGFRDEVFVADPDQIYLDGNSLGRLPRRTERALAEAISGEWGTDLIQSWEDRWLDLPFAVGDRLGETLLGAGSGQVLVSDSTSVNLYKTAAAALAARPDRTVIVTDVANFPTDRYILQGLAQATGRQLVMLETDPVKGPVVADLAPHLDEHLALVSLSLVAFKTAALADQAAITTAAHAVGALTLWDLSHAVGSVPIGLDDDGVDLAVGCSYKYLNGGPGAPAWLYVRRELQAALRQPIWGWFGQREQFEMGPAYDPVGGIGQFLVGTTPVLGVVAVREGVELLADAGIDRLRAKGIATTELLIALADQQLGGLGFHVGSPRSPQQRGSHVALRHPDAARLCRLLAKDYGVVCDFRPPDVIRVAPVPLYTRYVDVWDAVERIRAATERDG